jgi:hypothetical protein
MSHIHNTRNDAGFGRATLHGVRLAGRGNTIRKDGYSLNMYQLMYIYSSDERLTWPLNTLSSSGKTSRSNTCSCVASCPCTDVKLEPNPQSATLQDDLNIYQRT